MDELKKLLENAGVNEGFERTGGNHDELHIAFENVYLHLKDQAPQKAEALLLTRGEDGMTLFERERILNVNTKAREVYDVSGAGDTVISTLTIGLTAEASFTEAAYLANYAAGIVCEETGIIPIYLKQLKENIEKEFPVD